MEKSLAEQEREIKELIRRADKNPDRTGTTRRDTLSRLIDLTHSSHPTLKSLAAANIQNYFTNFPDLEDAAIDAIYDLCEDQVSSVRVAGYKAIVQVSKDQRKWLKRNADVLVQLLQSDEPDEVEVVKHSLKAHLDMDPRVTFGVLCDQIVPPDEPMDEEERMMRDRLRSLVLSFLTGEAKRAIVERHASRPGSDEEEVLVNGLLAAITKSTNAEIELIVKDLLLSLPSYQTLPSRGRDLLEAILKKATNSINVDLRQRQPSSLKDTRFYLDLAAFLVSEKRVAPAADLLRFYHHDSNLTRKMVLENLPTDDQIFVVVNIVETLAALDINKVHQGGPTPEQLETLRYQVVNASPFFLEVLAKSKMLQSRSWAACEVLLGACLRRKQESSWIVPTNLVTSLKDVEALGKGRSKEEGVEHVQDLIRSLLEPVVKPTRQKSSTNTGLNDTLGDTENQSRGEHRLSDLNRSGTTQSNRGANLPTKPRAERNGGSSASSRPSTNEGQASTSSAGPTTSSKRTASSDDSHRPPKKTKKGGGGQDTTPSLLSRMVLSDDPGSRLPSAARAPPRKSDSKGTTPSVHMQTSPDPVFGLSIKGAAQREGSSSGSNPRNVSLLDRIGRGNSTDGRRRQHGGQVHP